MIERERDGEALQRGRDRGADDGRVNASRQREDQALPAVRAGVELQEAAGLDRLHGLLVPLRVPAVRMPAREDEGEQLPLRALPGRVPLPRQVRQDLRPHPLQLLRGEDGVGEAVRRDPEGLPRRARRRPAAEHEDVLRDVELQGRAVPLERLRDRTRAPGLRPAEEEAGEELGDPLLPGPLRGDPGGEAPVEGDERARRVPQEQDAAPALEGDPLRPHGHGGLSAWYRTAVRVRSTRYVSAARRTSSRVTARTRAMHAGNASPEPRTSSCPIMNPWDVTPSSSYRFHARTSSRDRSISRTVGGASRSFATIPASRRATSR